MRTSCSMTTLLFLLALLAAYAAAKLSFDRAVRNAERGRGSVAYCRPDRSFRRSLCDPRIPEIPARFPAAAGTFSRIAQDLLKRTSMHNDAGEMHSIHSRAGPRWAWSCEKRSLLSAVFRESETGFRGGPSSLRNPPIAFRLWQAPSSGKPACAFLGFIHT
jgi:hypothetical protein